MKAPTYSICIPVYNRTLGFLEAINSALKVEGCTEIVVVDDNSSHEKFKELCCSLNDPKIKYYRNQTNLGLFGNWNKCIQLANSAFVSILCSDDLVEKDCYILFLNAYRANPSLDVFFGSFCTFSQSIEDKQVIREFSSGPCNAVNLLEDVVRNGPAFPVFSIMKRDTLLKYPFVSTPHSGNDWLWIYSHAMHLNLHAIDRPINYWRRHVDQDAHRSQSITTDCWPLMYIHVSEQLKEAGSNLANKALRRAKGVVLSWLLNHYKKKDGYFKRLGDEEYRSNDFIKAAREIIKGSWLLSNLLYSKRISFFYYNLGRFVRKIKYYPAP